MNKQEQNIAIAKACGYTQGVGMNGLEWWTNSEGVHDEPPDYVNSLDAMHEAEKVLQHYGSYCDQLALVMRVKRGSISLILATAAQRAEAFLRAIGKWEDGK